MSDALLNHLRALRLELNQERQRLTSDALKIRQDYKCQGVWRDAWAIRADELELRANRLAIQSGLFERVINNRGKLKSIFTKSQNEPRIFSSAIVAAYDLVIRNNSINNAKSRLT